MLGALSRSVVLVNNKILAASNKLDTSINQGTEFLNNTKMMEEQIRASETWQRQDSENVLRQLEQISTSQEQNFGQMLHSLAIFGNDTNNISMKMDSSMTQGPAILRFVSSTDQSITELGRGYREISEQFQTMLKLLEQSPAVMSNSAEPCGLLMQALDTRDRNQAQN
jgi:hypothetical protein